MWCNALFDLHTSKARYELKVVAPVLHPWRVNVKTLGGSVPDPDPPDPRVFGPPGSGSGIQIIRGIYPDPDPSIIKQKMLETPWFLCFVTTTFLLFIFEKWSGSRSISQRHGSADLDPHQDVMDPQHWKEVGEWDVMPFDLHTNKAWYELKVVP